MISFAVDPRFVQDLEDDFMVNEDLTLYEFIGKDPIRAFYLGYNIANWFKSIDRKQRYLYSKLARHNKDALEKYQDQISFWANKYPHDGNEIDMTHLSEYIINNMFFDPETEEIDKIKLAFFFGDTIATKQSQEQKEESDIEFVLEEDREDLEKEYNE